MQDIDQNQFAHLLTSNRRLLYSVIGSYCHDEHTKDDLYQEVCIRAWEAYKTFRGASKFSTWIAAIARNTAISWLRRGNQLKTVLCSNILWDIPDTEYEEAPVGLSMSVMAAFSEPEKETLRMRMEGLSFTEISAITGEPENRIRVRMHRLKKLLEEGARNRYKPKKVKV